MFLCTRRIDIHARFGIPRIAFLSFVFTVIMFLFSYEVLYYFSQTALSDHYFLILLVAIILLYPVHKAIHLLVFLPYFRSFRIHKLNKQKWLPFYNTYVSRPINKYYFCINLIMPFIVLTTFLVLASIKFPEYGHYFVFLIALNFGYSILDFLYLKIVLFSNDGSYIEEHQTGINILKYKKEAN